jgi:hypothetical protein
VDATLIKIRTLILRDEYSLSKHVRDKIADGDFALEDIEDSILSGNIVETQRDESGTAIDGKKHKILGRLDNGVLFVTVGKLVWNDEDNCEYFVITGYEFQ